MGVVTVSTSAARTPVRLGTGVSNQRLASKRPPIVAFKGDKSNNAALVSPSQEQIMLPLESTKKKRSSKNSNLQVSQGTLDLDYNEAAAKLENIYKLSPELGACNVSDEAAVIKRGRQRKRKTSDVVEKTEKKSGKSVVRNHVKKVKRLSLERRIELRKSKDECVVTSMRKKLKKDEDERIEELVKEYSGSTDLVSLDWKKMKIPPVLTSSEQTWLFKLMQPMKALLEVKENWRKDMGREPTEGELASAAHMNSVQLRRKIEVGRAARNKLIKHNLRLVLFVINKYFQDFANGPRFQDLCQAGVRGLIIAIDRFEHKRKLRLSTYGLFWIRHAIIRSMTVSSFTRVPFGLESPEAIKKFLDLWSCLDDVTIVPRSYRLCGQVRFEIQKAKLELLFKLQREPTEDEVIEKVGISPERYREVMRASKSVLSLHSRHLTTQEEFINGITDVDGGDDRRQHALLRLALDDVLDSLKPKESLVIRQRFGLDGKGDRTLGEIAGNLNISREMVRKHEVKALMKLKHPARTDYLRRYVI